MVFTLKTTKVTDRNSWYEDQMSSTKARNQVSNQVYNAVAATISPVSLDVRSVFWSICVSELNKQSFSSIYRQSISAPTGYAAEAGLREVFLQ